MALALDQDGGEPALQDVARALVARVEALGVGGVQALHAPRQVRPGRLDDQVVVVRHEAVGEAPPPARPDDLTEAMEEEAAVVVVEEDLLPRVAPGGDVIQRAGELDAQRPGHGRKATASAGQARSNCRAGRRPARAGIPRPPGGTRNSRFKI